MPWKTRPRRESTQVTCYLPALLLGLTLKREVPRVCGCTFLTGFLLLTRAFSPPLVFMYYFDNPGGQIPSWLINWAAKVSSQEAEGGSVSDKC